MLNNSYFLNSFFQDAYFAGSLDKMLMHSHKTLHFSIVLPSLAGIQIIKDLLLRNVIKT